MSTQDKKSATQNESGNAGRPEVTASRIREGLPFPLGASWDGLGVNFAIFFRQRHQGRTVPVRLGR